MAEYEIYSTYRFIEKVSKGGYSLDAMKAGLDMCFSN